jgi:hypothetical protein
MMMKDRLTILACLFAVVAFSGVVYADGPALHFEQDGTEVAYSDGMMYCSVLGEDRKMHRVDSRVCLALRSYAIGVPTPEPVFEDSAQEITVRPDWYADRHGNLVVNWGWLETIYEQNDEPLKDASPECRESMHDADPDSTVICLHKKAPKPINEPTPRMLNP